MAHIRTSCLLIWFGSEILGKEWDYQSVYVQFSQQLHWTFPKDFPRIFNMFRKKKRIFRQIKLTFSLILIFHRDFLDFFQFSPKSKILGKILRKWEAQTACEKQLPVHILVRNFFFWNIDVDMSFCIENGVVLTVSSHNVENVKGMLQHWWEFEAVSSQTRNTLKASVKQEPDLFPSKWSSGHFLFDFPWVAHLVSNCRTFLFMFLVRFRIAVTFSSLSLFNFDFVTSVNNLQKLAEKVAKTRFLLNVACESRWRHHVCEKWSRFEVCQPLDSRGSLVFFYADFALVKVSFFLRTCFFRSFFMGVCNVGGISDGITIGKCSWKSCFFLHFKITFHS